MLKLFNRKAALAVLLGASVLAMPFEAMARDGDRDGRYSKFERDDRHHDRRHDRHDRYDDRRWDHGYHRGHHRHHPHYYYHHRPHHSHWHGGHRVIERTYVYREPVYREPGVVVSVDFPTLVFPIH